MPSIGDLIFAFTDWLRNTPLLTFAIWVSNGSVCAWLQGHFFAIPLFQTLHILSIAVLFGSVLMINLRVLGVNGMSRTMTETLDRFQAWIWRALIVIVFTGVFMAMAEPIRNLINGFFWSKMIGLLTAVLVSLWFQFTIRHKLAVVGGDAAVTQSLSLRIGAVVLILLWCLVMAGGRYIAYAPV